MVKNTKKASDFWVGAIVMVISAIFFIEACKMPSQSRGIGPGDYPKFVCVLLFILGAVQVLRTLLSGGFPLVDWKNMQTRYLIRAFIMIAGTYVYYLLIDIIGFPLITPVYIWLSMMFFGYKKKVVAAVIAVVFSTAVYLLFTKVFMVLLPGGFLF